MRIKKCLGCKKEYKVSSKVAFDKSKYCSHKCYLEKIMTSEKMSEIGKKAKTHGMSFTKIYRVWGTMKSRCLNSNSAFYERYGGSGITIDKKWEKFIGFFEDMGRGYKEGLTIDRIDGTKGYCKKNCRWATRKEQSSNLKNNVFVDLEGEKVCMQECARRLGVHPSTIFYRIKIGKLKVIKK